MTPGKRSLDDVGSMVVALARRVDQLERARIKGVAWLGIVVMFVAYCLPAVVYTSTRDEDEVSVLRPFTLPWDIFVGEPDRPDESAMVAVVGIVIAAGVLWGMLGFLAWAGLPNRLRWWGLVGQIFLAVGLLGETVLAWGAPPDQTLVSPGSGLWVYLIGFSVGVAAQLMTIGYRARSAGD